MPVRGSGLEVAAARTTFSPKRTTAEPPACLASFPVSIVRRFPPVSSTDTEAASGFIDHPFYVGRRACARIRSSRGQADARRRLGTHFAKILGVSGTGSTRSRSRCYLRIPSLEITVLYRSESYFFR